MVKDNYLYSSIYQSIDDFIPEVGSTYIYGHSTEGRSYISNDLIIKHSKNVDFVELKDFDNDKIHDSYSDTDYFLRDSESMLKFFSLFKKRIIYVDTSGLNNRVNASLLNNAFKYFESLDLKDIRVIYAEPATYKVRQFSTEGFFNDLSESIKGIDPLPGFANIIPYDDDDETHFVALLGFEGGRFKYILENIEPNKTIVYPIVGVPGFRAEYPFVTYWGNRRPLDNTDIWSNIMYAAANSITDVYTLLYKIKKKSPSGRIKVAPIGTKPHAIGAILFAIKHPLKVEIIYDNPKRGKTRTDGVGKIIECSVYKLLKDK